MKILKLTSVFGSRVVVKFDTSASITIPLDTAVQYSLRSNLEISDDLFNEIQKTAQQQSRWNQVLKWVTLRPRSIAEFNYYAKDKLTAEQLSNFTSRLTELGFLSDEKFSSWLVSSRQSSRPKSTLELKQELKRKGISGSNLQTALSESDEQQACLDVAQKYAKKLSRFSDFEKKQKLFAYLLRRGFSTDFIKSAINKILSI